MSLDEHFPLLGEFLAFWGVHGKVRLRNIGFGMPKVHLGGWRSGSFLGPDFNFSQHVRGGDIRWHSGISDCSLEVLEYPLCGLRYTRLVDVEGSIEYRVCFRTCTLPVFCNIQWWLGPCTIVRLAKVTDTRLFYQMGYFLRVVHSCLVLAFFGVFFWVSRYQDMINTGILEEVPSSSDLLVDQLGLFSSFEDFYAAAALSVSCCIILFYLLC